MMELDQSAADAIAKLMEAFKAEIIKLRSASEYSRHECSAHFFGDNWRVSASWLSHEKGFHSAGSSGGTLGEAIRNCLSTIEPEPNIALILGVEGQS